MLPALAADRACVLVDLAGHGDSSDEATFSLQAWVTDCLEVVEHLGLGVLHVMGGSLGGAIALGVAAGLPGRVLSVTGLGSAIEPHPDPGVEPPAPADDAAAEQLFDGLAREAVAPGAGESVVRTVRRLTNRHGADVVTRILRAAYSADASPWLEDVRCPALWLTGEHDVTVSDRDQQDDRPKAGRAPRDAVRRRTPGDDRGRRDRARARRPAPALCRRPRPGALRCGTRSP